MGVGNTGYGDRSGIKSTGAEQQRTAPQDVAFSSPDFSDSPDNAQEEVGVYEGTGVAAANGITNNSRENDFLGKNS